MLPLTESEKELYYSLIHSKKAIKECRQFINDLFASCDEKDIKFVQRTQYVLNPKTFEFETEIHFLAEQLFPLKYETVIKDMKAKIIESQWNDHELMRYFKPESAIQVGQKLESISQLEKINILGQSSRCPIEEGEIDLIYLWTIYKPLCKKQLKWLNDTFIKNKWEGGAKFISINADHNREYAQKLIKLLGIDHMENYYIDTAKYPDHPFINVMNAYGCPLTIVVDNDNIIDSCGSLFDIDLVGKIENMLKREHTSTPSCFPTFGLNDFEKKNLKKLVKDMPRLVKENKQFIQAQHLCEITLIKKKMYTARKNANYMVKPKPKCQMSCSLNYYCQADDEKAFDAIFQGIDQIRKMNVNKNYINTQVISFAEMNTYCGMCQSECLTYSVTNFDDTETEISEIIYNNQYYCAQCNVYYCRKCGDMISDIKTPSKVHRHFLYYLHPKSKDYMKFILSYNLDNSHDSDFKYFFENAKTGNYNETHYQAKCDGCLSFPIRTCRWKCCNCICRNICHLCMSIIFEKKADSFYDEIISNIQQVGCDPVHHVFLKIIFDCFDY